MLMQDDDYDSPASFQQVENFRPVIEDNGLYNSEEKITNRRQEAAVKPFNPKHKLLHLVFKS
jgi:hypothetical protein